MTKDNEQKAFDDAHRAAMNGDCDAVSKYVGRSTSPDGRPDSLMLAAAHAGKISMTELVSEAGASVNHPADSRGFTPLHVAAAKANIDVYKRLVELGANQKARPEKNPESPRELLIRTLASKLAPLGLRISSEQQIDGKAAKTPADERSFSNDAGRAAQRILTARIAGDGSRGTEEDLSRG